MNAKRAINAPVRHAATSVHGIFCLEADYWGSLETHRSFTVRPIFDLVSQIHSKLRYIHRFVATRAEFDYYLSQWSLARYANYPILYLAMHGDPNRLYLGSSHRSDALSLDDLSARLAGACRNRVVHLASCATVRTDRRHLTRFLKVTRASAVSGYTADVGMLEPSAFEILMLNAMQYHTLDPAGVRKIDEHLSQLVPSLRRQMGFRFVRMRE